MQLGLSRFFISTILSDDCASALCSIRKSPKYTLNHSEKHMIYNYFRWFERITMLVILVNCVTLGMYKPCADTSSCNKKCLVLKVSMSITFTDHTNKIQIADGIIYIYFTGEMMIKMVSTIWTTTGSNLYEVFKTIHQARFLSGR